MNPILKVGTALAVPFMLLGCEAKGRAPSSVASPADVMPASADAGLAIDPETGDVLMSWIGGDSASWQLYVARSRDAGATWSPPVRVTGGEGEVHPHGEASPRIVAASRNRVALVWAQNIVVPGRKWPASRIRVSRSLDGGATWLPATTVNDDTTGAATGHTFHGAAWVGDSGIQVAWLDERPGLASAPPATGSAAQAGTHEGHDAHEASSEPDSRVYTVASQDFGETWGPNRALWDAACPCCRVSLTRKPDGSIDAAWRKHFPGNVRDVVVGPVNEPAAEPTRVNVDGWVYPGCPHTGPAVATGPEGATHVVWYTGKEGAAGVYYDKLGGKESAPTALITGKGVGTAHAAVAPLRDGGAVAAYDALAPGKVGIRVAVVDPSGSVTRQQSLTGGTNGKYPQVVVSGDSVAIVAWTETGSPATRIRVGRLSVKG